MSSSAVRRVRVAPDGSVARPGVETPKGTKVHHKDSRRDPFNTLVIKVPGHKYWSALRTQSYAAAEYIVYQVTDGHAEGDIAVYDVAEVTRFPVKDGS